MCLCEGISPVSGQWRVECVNEKGEGEVTVRRLVFMKTYQLVQSEVRLKSGLLSLLHV